MRALLFTSTFIFSTLLFISSLSSCKKDVPSGKTLYVGEWHSSYNVTIKISKDGSGFWEEEGKYINGRVKFTSSGFEIKALGFKKKFSVSQEPTALPAGSSSSYKAIFNGENFYR